MRGRNLLAELGAGLILNAFGAWTTRKRRVLTTRWTGEALREMAVLVAVFVPLDWIHDPAGPRRAVVAFTFIETLVLFFAGVALGSYGEEERSEDAVG